MIRSLGEAQAFNSLQQNRPRVRQSKRQVLGKGKKTSKTFRGPCNHLIRLSSIHFLHLKSKSRRLSLMYLRENHLTPIPTERGTSGSLLTRPPSERGTSGPNLNRRWKKKSRKLKGNSRVNRKPSIHSSKTALPEQPLDHFVTIETVERFATLET